MEDAAHVLHADVASGAQPPQATNAIFHAGQELTCTVDSAFVVIPGPWKEPTCYLMSLVDGECFRVDDSTGMLSEEELHTYEELVREADLKEDEVLCR